MVRITVHDRESTISFRGDFDLAHCLVAACASEPDRFEALLIATEPYRPGVVTRVMHDLLQFDAAVELQQTVSLARAFEVQDTATDLTWRHPDEDGLVVFDLERHSVAGSLSVGESIHASGSIRTRPGGGLERQTVYALSNDWVVDIETNDRPDLESVSYA